MLPNRARYLESIASELRAQENRVRDLIGDAHWLSDGHHKEYLLHEVLSRHMPSGVLLGRGFVIHPNRHDIVSKEQDVLIVDAAVEAPVFHQGGLLVTLPANVLASLSVKTTLSRGTVADAIHNLASLTNLVAMSAISPPHVWSGAYFFGLGPEATNDHSRLYVWMESALGKLRTTGNTNTWAGPDVLACARELAVLANQSIPDLDPASVRLRGFDVDGAVVLLAHLLSHISVRRGATSSSFVHFAEVTQSTPFAGKPVHDFTCAITTGSPSRPRKKRRPSPG